MAVIIRFYATGTTTIIPEGVTPEPYRFKASEDIEGVDNMAVDWVDSLFTIAYHKGASCGVYDFGKDMSENSRVFIHHDADVMFLPRENVLKIRNKKLWSCWLHKIQVLNWEF